MIGNTACHHSSRPGPDASFRAPSSAMTPCRPEWAHASLLRPRRHPGPVRRRLPAAAGGPGGHVGRAAHARPTWPRARAPPTGRSSTSCTGCASAGLPEPDYAAYDRACLARFSATFHPGGRPHGVQGIIAGMASLADAGHRVWLVSGNTPSVLDFKARTLGVDPRIPRLGSLPRLDRAGLIRKALEGCPGPHLYVGDRAPRPARGGPGGGALPGGGRPGARGPPDPGPGRRGGAPGPGRNGGPGSHRAGGKRLSRSATACRTASSASSGLSELRRADWAVPFQHHGNRVRASWISSRPVRRWSPHGARPPGPPPPPTVRTPGPGPGGAGWTWRPGAGRG